MNKRLLSLALTLSVFATPVLAGEVNTPGKTEPPPPPACTENCGTQATTTTTDAVLLAALELLLSLIKR